MKRVQYITFALSAILICVIAWTSISGVWRLLMIFAAIFSIVIMFIALKLEARWRDEKKEETHNKELDQRVAEIEQLNETITQIKQQSYGLSLLPNLREDDFMNNTQLLENFFEQIVVDQSMKEFYNQYFRQIKEARCAKEVIIECRNSVVRPFLAALSKEEPPLTEERNAALLEQLVELAMVCIDIAETPVFYTNEVSNNKPYVAFLKGLKSREEVVGASKEITDYPDATPRDARVMRDLLAKLNFKYEQLSYFGYKIVKK